MTSGPPGPPGAPGTSGAPDASHPAPEVVVGEVTRPHGVRGAVRVRPTGPTLAGLRAGDAVVLCLGDGTRTRAVIASLGDGGPGGMILTLRGAASRDDVEALRGALIRIPADRLPPTGPDEFYVRDLLGCRVMVGDAPLGEVAAVHPGPANDVLEIRPDHPGPAVLIPFTRDAVTDLDIRGRRLVVREDLLPEDRGEGGDGSAPA